jgi:PBP1b-binding outer membrane lipoprotein LpoB
MLKVKRCAALLLLPVLLSACAGSPAAIVNADALCRDWRHQTVSKADKITDQTATDIEANNKSRPNWGCEYGANKAKG